MTRKNVFGQPLWLKRKLFQLVGILTRKRLIKINHLNIKGSEILLNLPDRNVLFISNHETIYLDVIAMFHVMFATLSGQPNSIEKNNYMKRPKLNVYFVAARETMKDGFLPRMFAMGGAVTVDRTWKQGDELIEREVNLDDTKTIGIAIKDGWVVTFPQGTTTEGAPVRKGTAHIIKQYKPLVVPIRLSGFRKAFDKTGLKIREKGVNLSLLLDEPLTIDYEKDTVEALVEKIGEAIRER